MQDKMATRSRVVNALYSASFYAWFPVVRLLTRLLPRRALNALARQTIGRFFDFRPKYLHAIRGNFSRILGEAADSSEVAAAARDMIDNHSYHWIDFFYFAQRPLSAARSHVEGIEEREKIFAAERQGRGVIIATAHLGNWYVGGFLLAGLDHKIHVVYKPDRFAVVEKLRSRMQKRWGIGEIPVGATAFSALPIVRALRDGQIVAMQCDRDFNNTGVAVEFFGRPAFFPRGPFVAAMATGAVVLPSFVLRTPDDNYRVAIEDPLPIARGGDPEADLRANVEAFVAILERYVRADPTQWYCFYPFWDDPSRTSATRSSRRRRESGSSSLRGGPPGP
jgi:KDO2-lipid IV(A) lauroyltransferase